MNKTDWIAYFEAINARTPNDTEIAQALAAGEFSDVSSSDASEVSQPENLDDSKQADVTETVTEAAALKAKEAEVLEKIKDNQVVVATENFFSQYWSWLLLTLKQPIEKTKKVQPYFMWVTFALVVVFTALSTTLNVHAFYEKNVVQSGLSSLANFAGIHPTNPIGFGSFIALLFVFAIFLLTLIFATWVGQKVLKSTQTFLGVTETIAKIAVPVSYLTALGLVLALIRLNFLSYLVLLLALSVLSFATTYQIMTTPSRLKMDNFYAKLLASLTAGLIVGVIMFFVLLFVVTTMLRSTMNF